MGGPIAKVGKVISEPFRWAGETIATPIVGKEKAKQFGQITGIVGPAATAYFGAPYAAAAFGAEGATTAGLTQIGGHTAAIVPGGYAAVNMPTSAAFTAGQTAAAAGATLTSAQLSAISAEHGPQVAAQLGGMTPTALAGAKTGGGWMLPAALAGGAMLTTQQAAGAQGQLSEQLYSRQKADIQSQYTQQKGDIAEAQKQSLETWRETAFPSKDVIKSAESQAMAAINQRTMLARRQLDESMAARGMGGGMLRGGYQGIEEQRLKSMSELAAQLTQFGETPMQAAPLGGAVPQFAGLPQTMPYQTAEMQQANLMNQILGTVGGISAYKWLQ